MIRLRLCIFGKNAQWYFCTEVKMCPQHNTLCQCQGLKRQGTTKELLGSTENEQENNQMQCGGLGRTPEPKKGISRDGSVLRLMS